MKLKKTLKIAAVWAMLSLLCAPVLLIANEQPDGEPQRWLVNLTGWAWLGLLVWIGKRTDVLGRIRRTEFWRFVGSIQKIG